MFTFLRRAACCFGFPRSCLIRRSCALFACASRSSLNLLSFLRRRSSSLLPCFARSSLASFSSFSFRSACGQRTWTITGTSSHGACLPWVTGVAVSEGFIRTKKKSCIFEQNPRKYFASHVEGVKQIVILLKHLGEALFLFLIVHTKVLASVLVPRYSAGEAGQNYRYLFKTRLHANRTQSRHSSVM